MGRQKAEIDLEQLIYEKNPQVQFKLQAGQVTIIRPQNHWIQRTLRFACEDSARNTAGT